MDCLRLVLLYALRYEGNKANALPELKKMLQAKVCAFVPRSAWVHIACPCVTSIRLTKLTAPLHPPTPVHMDRPLHPSSPRPTVHSKPQIAQRRHVDPCPFVWCSMLSHGGPLMSLYSSTGMYSVVRLPFWGWGRVGGLDGRVFQTCCVGAWSSTPPPSNGGLVFLAPSVHRQKHVVGKYRVGCASSSNRTLFVH